MLNNLFSWNIQPNKIQTVNLFDGYQYKNINRIMQKLIQELLQNNFLIFDYTPFNLESIKPNKSNKSNKSNIITRSNLSAFVQKSVIMDLATTLSKLGCIICIFDTDLSIVCIYSQFKVMSDEDFITSYEIYYDENKVLSHNNLEHVWNYGTDIDRLKSICGDRSFEQIKTEYIEIAILSKEFDQNILLDICLDYYKKIDN